MILYIQLFKNFAANLFLLFAKNDLVFADGYRIQARHLGVVIISHPAGKVKFPAPNAGYAAFITCCANVMEKDANLYYTSEQ